MRKGFFLGWGATSDLGADGKLTTCARIELTTAKPGVDPSQVPANRAGIRAPGAQVLPNEQTSLDRHHPARRCRVPPPIGGGCLAVSVGGW